MDGSLPGERIAAARIVEFTHARREVGVEACHRSAGGERHDRVHDSVVVDVNEVEGLAGVEAHQLVDGSGQVHRVAAGRGDGDGDSREQAARGVVEVPAEDGPDVAAGDHV